MYPEITLIYNEPFPKGYDFGGEERAVNGVMECVNSVHIALLDCGYIVDLVPIVPPLGRVRKQLLKVKTELVFNLFEGFYDYPESESEVAHMLDEMGFRFTGCRSKALHMALDKANSKELMAKSGIDTPCYQVINPSSIHKFNLEFPCIVKPRNQDASHGITPQGVVKTLEDLEKQVNRLINQFGGDAIVEELLTGREFNVTVLGNNDVTVLPASEIIYSLPPDLPRVLTYEAKWITDSEYYKNTSVACPAHIDENLIQEIASIAVSSFRLFECSGYARVDMRQDASGHLKVMEVNPNPDISPDTGAARQAFVAGIAYSQLIEKIVDYALESVLA